MSHFAEPVFINDPKNLDFIHSFQSILTLVLKDVRIELRQKQNLYGILVYAVSSIFILFMAINKPDTEVWQGLYWILQLFICVNAVAKTFAHSLSGELLYYYTVAGSTQYIVSKLIFNALLMFFINLVSLLCFILFMGNPLLYVWKFVALSGMASVSLSLVFTFLSAIASKAEHQASMIAILGFPLIIPQLLIIHKASIIAFSSVLQAGLGNMLGLLFVLDTLVVALSIILYPFLWKD